MTALLSGLIGPLLLTNLTVQDSRYSHGEDRADQTRADSLLVIKNDFASAMDQFLATFDELRYKSEHSKTYLYVPKDSLSKSIDELIRDKAMVTRFDGRSC